MLIKEKKHTLSIYVANKPGVLVRVAEVFSRRSFNIDSLVVSPAINGKFSRMTISAKGNNRNIEQMKRQLNRLVDVLKVVERDKNEVIEEELALIKTKTTSETRTEILQIIEHFKGTTVDFHEDSLVTMVTGRTEKLDAFIEMMKNYKIIELVRTGVVMMARGPEET